MRAARLTFGVLAATAMAHVSAQTPYPDLTLQDLAWTDGTHHYAVTQKILSPSTPDLPVAISGTADAEFVSGTQVRLRPGFHAGGLSGNGRFRARIDQTLGPVGDVIIISPAPDGSSPYGSIEDNVVHVHKWEKVEVGLRLPQEYQDAIDRFFQHYYPYNHPPYPPGNPNTNVAVPGNVDRDHDLNPYADDSLQLVMTLTDPSGDARMKWGFFMREGKWESDLPNAKLTEDLSGPLHPYTIRFRFAPDQEGPWQFSLSLKAPYTTTPVNASLQDHAYSGYALICEPPLPSNHGNLRVNANNGRALKFEDDTPFFGLGPNMADTRGSGAYLGIIQQDFNLMLESIGQLHSVEGNFLRMFLMRNLFAPEWVNLGVYDAFHALYSCVPNDPAPWAPRLQSNGQYQCWAFDHLLDHARENNVYIQLCIDPYPPIVAYQANQWVMHPFLNFLKPFRDNTIGVSPYDLKRFFYSTEGDVDPDDPQAVRLYNEGAFYYWKRRYKYLMSRWGYSVNLPIIEPFNEIDQMLTYQYADLRPDQNNQSPLCPGDRVEWFADPELPNTVSDWFTDIAQFVRGAQDANDPAHSPLGEDSKLFLVSYAGGSHSDIEHHAPFLNDEVDLIDAHRAPQNPWDLRAYGAEVEQYRNNFMTTDGRKKPFNQGEWTTYGNYSYPETPPHIFEYGGSYRLFDNYDVSFHNEIWAGAFSGKFATGTTWGWERVFWWPDALPVPPNDDLNPAGPNHSNVHGATNSLFLGLDQNNDELYAEVENRPLHHHFKPLSDFLNKPSVQALGLFVDNFTPRIVEADGIECFYLINDAQDIAVGWVHNANAFWRKAVYITSQFQNYMECADPSAQSIAISGFAPNTEFKISYHPTRATMTDLPVDEADGIDSGSNGVVTLDLSSAPLNGTFPLSLTAQFRNHLDTLHSDYAFIIATDLIKRLNVQPEIEEVSSASDWDFAVYPNPVRDGFSLRFADDVPKAIDLIDLSGRVVRSWSGIASAQPQLPIDGLACGAYWVRATDGVNRKSKKLLIH